MKTISMIAQKGGTGKTTLSIHLAVQASLSGINVLLVDIDPQASATAWWRRRRTDKPELAQTNGKKLQGVMNSARQQGYELIVIDSAPHSSADARTCAQLSDLILIPSRPAILDLDAISVTTNLVEKVGVPAKIVLNACPPPTRYGEPHIVSEAREALQLYKIPVCESILSHRAAFSHALIDGRAITEFDPKSKAALEILMLWNTIIQELELWPDAQNSN